MFARHARLSRTEIAHLMKHGRKYAGRFFYARALPADSFAAAFSIGKKISRLSVSRHLLKRRAAHALRAAAGEAPAPVHLFLIARPEARAASYDALANDLGALLRQISGKSV